MPNWQETILLKTSKPRSKKSLVDYLRRETLDPNSVNIIDTMIDNGLLVYSKNSLGGSGYVASRESAYSFLINTKFSRNGENVCGL